MGTLNRHSRLLGNDPAQHAQKSLRGQRVYCSNRGSRPGCGGTFAIYLAHILPRHSVTALHLWLLLLGILTGASLRATAHTLRLPFPLETLYGILRRLRCRLDRLRTLLFQLEKPPLSDANDPLALTIAHLQASFADNAPQAFQSHFQTPIFG